MYKNKNFRMCLTIFFMSCLIYGFSVDGDSFKTQGFNHYNHLANAFLNGRLNIENSPTTHDLSKYKDKFYVPFPILPAIILMPLVFFYGVGFKVIYVTILIGALNVALVYFLLTRLNSSKFLCMLLAFAFGFGTVHWWSTIEPGVWYMAHIFAVFFMLLALIESTDKKRPLIMALFIGFAFMCRQFTILSFPYFSYVLIENNIKNLSVKKFKEFFENVYIKKLFVFFSVLFLFILQYCLYNYFRFGNPFDTGYQYIELSSMLNERFVNGGMFSIVHLPFNLFIFLFKAPEFIFNSFVWKAPFIRFDPLGIALIFTSPFLFYAFRNFSRKTLSIWISCLLIFGPQLFYYNTGWVQFGYRYFLDVLPLFMLLLGKLEFKPEQVFWFSLLLLYSIVINLLSILLPV